MTGRAWRYALYKQEADQQVNITNGLPRILLPVAQKGNVCSPKQTKSAALPRFVLDGVGSGAMGIAGVLSLLMGLGLAV